MRVAHQHLRLPVTSPVAAGGFGELSRAQNRPAGPRRSKAAELGGARGPTWAALVAAVAMQRGATGTRQLTAPPPPISSVEPAVVVSGLAAFIDGDTSEIHGQRIGFDGIDTPELSSPATLLASRGGVDRRRRMHWPSTSGGNRHL
jgi:hypothetical protein